MDPGMIAIGDAVKLQNGDAPIFRLRHRAFEIVEGPFWAAVAGRRDQQWMIDAWLIRKAAPLFIRIFGRATTPRETDAEFLQYRERFDRERIARPGKRLRARDATL